MTPAMERFAQGCAEVCETAQSETGAILMTNDWESDGVLACEFRGRLDPTAFSDASRTMFVSREYASMATRVKWTPDGGESSPAWCFTAVSALGGPAVVMVRRDEGDSGWWHIEMSEAPWFALATASGLRAALKGEAPLIPKYIPSGDRRLLDRPGQGPPPPTDRQGRL